MFLGIFLIILAIFANFGSICSKKDFLYKFFVRENYVPSKFYRLPVDTLWREKRTEAFLIFNELACIPPFV
jgi:hypothetical protein